MDDDLCLRSLPADTTRDRVLLKQLTRLLSAHCQLRLGGLQPNRLDVSIGEASSGSSYVTCRSRSPRPGEGPLRTISMTSIQSGYSDYHLIRSSTMSFSLAKAEPLTQQLTPDEMQQIEKGFMMLYSRLEGTAAARLSEAEPLIYVEEVQEFFLSAYISSESTFRVLMEPLRRSKWVSLDVFKRSVLRIYRSDLMIHNMSSKAAATWKNNYNTLKLLFFFRLVSYNDCLRREEMYWVVRLAMKGAPENLQSAIVSKVFLKANTKRGFESETVTLKELYEVLKA